MLSLTRSHIFGLLGVVFSLICFLLGTPEERLVILPGMVLLNVSILSLYVLWKKDKRFPLFDVGAMFIIACLLYTLMPALGFLASGMQYNVLSTMELQNLAPTAQEFSSLLWRYVVFAVCFAAVYARLRPYGLSRQVVQSIPAKSTLFMLILLVLLAEAGFEIVKAYAGVDFRATYDRIEDTFQSLYALPVFLQQILGNVISIVTILKMLLIVLIIAYWKKGREHWAVLLLVTALLVSYLLRAGSRTEIVVLVVTCILAYHRFVRPLRVRSIFFAGILVFVVFMTFGLMRGGADIKSNYTQLEYLTSHDVPLLSIANEFQVLFGCTYDLFDMSKAGVLGQVPLQLNFYDVLLLVPNQLLPFDKINPTLWYWEFSSTKGFFSFNPVAQSIVGLDWLELVFRGAVLGWVFAMIHGWYLRRSSSFYATFSYLFLIVWSYYSIKASTFMWAYFIIYRLVPALLLIHVLNALIASVRKDPSFKMIHRTGSVI